MQSDPDASVERDAADSRTSVAALPGSRARGRRALLRARSRDGRRCRGSAVAALRARRRAVRHPEPARTALVALAAARRARRLVRALDRVVGRARPQLELREPRVRLPRVRARRRATSPRDTAPARSTASRACSARSASGRSPGRCCPWLHEDYGRIARLSAPVGYWNALALLGDIALPLGLCLATRMRTAGTLLVYGWIVVIGLTYSRGGVLVAVVVVALWMLLSKAWLEALSTLLAAGLPGGGVARGRASRSPGSRATASRTRRACATASSSASCSLADAAIAAALARYALPRDARSCAARAGARSPCSSSPRSRSARSHARTWWDIVHGAGRRPSCRTRPSRLVQLGSNFRWVWWTQAWKGCDGTSRSTGTGAGSFEVTNLRYRTIEPRRDDRAARPAGAVPERDRDRRRRCSSSARSPGSSSAGGAAPGPQLALALALPAYFLHGLLDIDWDFVSVSALVFLIAGALVVRPLDAAAAAPFTGRSPPAASSLALAVSLLAVWLGDHWEDQARPPLAVDNAQAITLAKRARSRRPARSSTRSSPLRLPRARSRRAASSARPGWAQRYEQRQLGAHGYLIKATKVQPDERARLVPARQLPARRAAAPTPRCRPFNQATVYDGKNPAYSTAYATTLAACNSGKAKC